MRTLARERDRDDLLRRLASLRPDSVRRWGRMDAHQMICHLTDAFRMSLGERTVSRLGGFRGLMFRVTKWMPLYAPVQWPAGIRTRPEVEQGIGGTCPTDFAADLAELITVMDTVTRHASESWPPHPMFGPLSRRAWLRWGYLHVDHHLRQFGV
jgi:hypothetical protein